MRIFRTLFAALILIPTAAHAHVKWFAPESYPPVEPYNITDWPVIAWILIGLVIIGIGVALDKRGPMVRGKLGNTLHYCEPMALTLFSIFSGLALFFYATQGFIFAPNLFPEGPLTTVMLFMQAAIGLALVLGVFVRTNGIILLALYVLAVVEFGAIEMIDALEVVGIGLFLLVVGRPRWRLTKWSWIDEHTKQCQSYAIPILRVFTGFNLIALGLSEKILNPALGMAFLSEYDWNFMQMLGFEWYTDYWFIFSAGAVELLLGVVFVLGIVTRLNTIVLSLFFIATLILMGPMEVVGHTMHFAIVGMLIIFGAGSRLKITPERRHA